MVVLVAYATAHGSTREIAERIGARLERRDVRADVRSVADAGSVDDWDAVVAGSAIHDGKWLPEAVEFLESQCAALATRPVYLFSVSLVGETTSAFPGPMARQLRRPLRRSRRGLSPAVLRAIAGHRWFAGVIEQWHWPGAPGRAFFRAMRGRYGDHRDWDDVDEWADTIAAQLGVRPVR